MGQHRPLHVATADGLGHYRSRLDAPTLRRLRHRVRPPQNRLVRIFALSIVVTVSKVRSCHPDRGRETLESKDDERRLRAHVLGKDRAWLVAHDDATLTEEQSALFESLIARRATGEPIAYIVGEAWFYGRRFEVNPNVLVPRPETEHLIDDALAYLRGFEEMAARHPVVLDVGTGCGAIACTIAAELPNALVYATERSPTALEVAHRNASAHMNANTPNLCIELADLVPDDNALKFDCVIANLPYVPTDDLAPRPDATSFEPREALDGGADGLGEYRRLLEVLPQRLNPRALVLLEAAPPTIAGLRALVVGAFPGANVSVESDYARLERYVRGQTPVRDE